MCDPISLRYGCFGLAKHPASKYQFVTKQVGRKLRSEPALVLVYTVIIQSGMLFQNDVPNPMMGEELTSYQQWPLGVAPLTALDATVEEYVTAAASAGLDAVGVRPYPVVDTDPDFPAVNTPRFNDLKKRIADHGLSVLDIEVFTVASNTVRDDWAPIIDAGHQLGARYMNIVGVAEDPSFFENTIGEITADAAEAGIVPVLEPVAYRALNSFSQAIDIANRVGCKVELDMLHFLRTGASIDLILDNPDMFPVLQLCDAPKDIGTIRDELIPFSASGSDLDLQIAESRNLRQLPGEGDAPIGALLEIVGPHTSISIEIPNARVRASLDVSAYFALLAEHARTFLAPFAHLSSTSHDKTLLPNAQEGLRV